MPFHDADSQFHSTRPRPPQVAAVWPWPDSAERPHTGKEKVKKPRPDPRDANTGAAKQADDMLLDIEIAKDGK